MQPYLLPYTGYFQLVNSVDRFVIYDDVQFIKNGWINRNRTLVNGTGCYFTFQLKKASTFDKINQRKFTDRLPIDIKKFLKGLEISYRKAPYYESVIEVVKCAVDFSGRNVSELVTHALRTICNYMEIKAEFIISSNMNIPDDLHAQDRVIWINEALGANAYINVAGGMELYDHDIFASHGIKLSFLQPQLSEYKQFNNEFVPNLSIVDVLMFNGKDRVIKMLEEYEEI